MRPDVPKQMFAPTPHAEPQRNTPRGIATWLANEQTQLNRCNADKQFICTAGGWCKHEN